MSARVEKRSLSFVVGATAVAIAAALFACADADDAIPPDGDAGPSVVPDGNAGDAGAEPDDSSAPPATCSPGGWCHTELPADVTLTGVWGDGSGVVWATSEEGHVLRWEADAWKVHASGLGSLRTIWGASPVDIWVSSDAGLLHGQGASSASVAFTTVTVPGDPSATITSIWGTGPDDVWAVGGRADIAPYAGRVLHFGGAGGGWTLEDVTSDPIAFSHVWGSPASGVWMAGFCFDDAEFFDEGVILHRAPNETAFAPVKLPGNPDDEREHLGRIGGVTVPSTGVMLLVGKTTYDTPSTWRATSTDNGQSFAWTFRRGSAQDFAMNAVLELGENDAWAAGEYGRLRHWNGTEWTQSAVSLTKLPLTRDFFAMWGQPSKDLWVVGDRLAVKRDLSK